jgi:hypothetical protein
MIFEEVGKPARIQAAPKMLLRAMGLFNPGMRELIEMLYEFEEPFVVDHSKFEQAFGEHAPRRIGNPSSVAYGGTERSARPEREVWIKGP